MATALAPRGIVLFAHGSRDPLWRTPIEAVQRYIAQHHPDAQARCAYLELTAPDLHHASAELVALGVASITIVPMFLGTGRHAREDLPLLVEQLRSQHPQTPIHVQNAIGEDPRMTALMAAIACTPQAEGQP